MQTVPSLVGTGTVVAAAATGLVFGQPEPAESTLPTSARPTSPFKRKLFADFNFDSPRATPTPPPSSRPTTSSALNPPQFVEEYPSFSHDQTHPSPLASNPVNVPRQPPTAGAQTTPPKANSRRHSHIRPVDVLAANIPEGSRESFSSHGSWIRRLSLRPTSQHGSPRSSIGPDSSCQGSGPPILSPAGSVAPQMPPNKLVKRPGMNDSIFARRGSRTQVPTLRRPATSHQRSSMVQQLPNSATTYQFPLDKPSLEQPSRPCASTTGQHNAPWRIHEPSTWSSFFHARRVRTSKRGSLVLSPNENRSADSPLPGINIHLRRRSLPVPHLVNPQVISGETLTMTIAEPELEQVCPVEPLVTPDKRRLDPKHSAEQPEMTPTKSPRRSLSAHFSPPNGWIARAGSLRRQKIISAEPSGGRRYASDPVPSTRLSNVVQSNGEKPTVDELFTPPTSGNRASQNMGALASRDHGRTSPIPPLSRISTLHMDLCRMGPSPPSSAGLGTPSLNQVSPIAAPHGASISSHSRAVSKEGASTLAGSEMSVPGLASGDDDDTDYKSDAVFDSFRTTDSNRLRVVETPLESMFDDCYPGTASNVKTKRLSIQEILGNSLDGDTKIVEEDEGTSTPIRGLHSPHIENDLDDADDRATEIAKFQISIGSRNFGRLSLDTMDDDFDWAKEEDDVLSNPLSPPTSSVNSRRGPSPQLRRALASISGNGTPDSTVDDGIERPRSNLFDWSEPSHDKDDEGLPRPRTVHGKQELDLRAGRPSNRKGLPSVHVRSQSVPTVHDIIDSVKGAPKFGTWGIGAKTANEDWDDDFEFEEGSSSGSGSGSRNPTKSLSMQVPPSIAATQPTVKAHSGQIRELSLLVSNLKRLCRQGRDLNLLAGQSASLWKEAENIIALASPDEESDEDETDGGSDFDPSAIDERFLEEGFDAAMLDRPEASVGASEPDIPKNAVVREREVVRRRSVFCPGDDIFGNNYSLEKVNTRPHTPKTPDRVREFHTPDGAVVSSVIAAMEQQRSQPDRPQESPLKPSKAKLFFDTNSLQELVKRASTVFHALSDIVRKEELLTRSPQVTPKHDRHLNGGSPAFTRVFTDPEAGPPRRLVRSQQSHSPLPRQSLDSNGLGQRMQMMIVS